MHPRRRGLPRAVTLTATVLLTLAALAAAAPGRASAEGAGQGAGAGAGEGAREGRRGGLAVRGADISFTLQEEAAGSTFSDRGKTRPVERILADHGANYVRLRVWVDPPAGFSDADAALELARRAKRAGMKVLLDLHYSDFWADPGKQPIPAAWQGQDLPTLAATVHDYTRDLVRRFARHGAPVDMIQIGNEVVAGMLWPAGQLYHDDGTEHWEEFTTLLNAGIDGARDGNPRRHDLRVMVHIDRGGDNGGTRYFYDHLDEQGVDFDVIGLSYYPVWHGSFAQLGANLDDTASRYGKDVVVVETAYPWTLANHDTLENHVTGAAQLPDAATYPPTPEGQAAYLDALRDVIAAVPDGRGLGFFYWEPEWIPGVGWEPGAGNPHDNLTLFDQTGRGLPALDAFRR